MKDLLKDLEVIEDVAKYEIEFTRTINTQRAINATGSIKRVLEALTPTDDSNRATFGEQVTSLESGLAKHGVYNFAEMYKIKELYIKKRATHEGSYPKALIHYSRVYDAVINRALRVKAITLSKAEARDYDLHKQELNEIYGEAFYPQERVGESWLPIAMEDIALVDDAQAGEWDTGSEPYAGTSFLDMI